MSEPYIGEIRIFAGSFAPQGWAYCDGSTISIADNDTLFTLLGTTYGGDGQTTFKLPDLRGRIPLHMGTSTFGTYTLGQQAGTENVTLTTQQIPGHTHAIAANNGAANVGTPAGNIFGSATISHYASPGGAGATGPIATASGGTSQPHSNIMPYLGISFIISLYGVYPSQS
jgi:microcystin-dependent protein